MAMKEITPIDRAVDLTNHNPKRVSQLITNVDYLVNLNEPNTGMKRRIQRIMGGGTEAVEELMGSSFAGADIDPPFANLMINANNKLGQKLGKHPEARIEPPYDNDTERARDHAQIREEVCNYLDSNSKLNLRLPQAGRWVPGYGFSVFTIKESEDRNGLKYPHVQLRDPFDTYPGPWGLDQQPSQVAFKYELPYALAVQYFPQLLSPQYERKLKGYERLGGGAVLLNPTRSGYESQGGDSIAFYEYMDQTGTYIVNMDTETVLAANPNPIFPTTHFYTIKRFSFSKLSGALDHAIGLMGAMARLNILMITAMEDAVNSETNIFGELQGQRYHRGRGQVNYFGPNTRVENPSRTMPYQIFQQADSIKQDARVMMSYPITEDAQAPMSFITGRGVDALNESISGEVNEYLMLFRDALEEIDYRRLKWLEKRWPNQERSIEGLKQNAAYATSFTPATHIKGRYITTRPYGLMASLDDTNRLIGMLHLLDRNIIDSKTVRENTDIENVSKVEERIYAERSEGLLWAALEQRAAQGDPASMEAALSLLPNGEMKTLLTRIFNQQNQQQQMGPGNGMEALLGAPPDVNTLLSRQTTSGNPVLGSQSVV